MYSLYSRLLLTLIISSSVIAAPALSQTRLMIVDQNNAPLSNAVIEYSRASILEPTDITQNDDKVYIMDQVNKQFEPHVLIIPEDSLVSFPNSDDIRHHVYSFSEPKVFELKLYAGKPKKPIRFNQSGLVVMGCNIHDSMVGYIYVSSHDNTYMSNEKGEILLPHTLPANTQVNVWHPESATGVSKHVNFLISQSMLDKSENENENEVVLKVSVNPPATRDSFEELDINEY